MEMDRFSPESGPPSTWFGASAGGKNCGQLISAVPQGVHVWGRENGLQFGSVRFDLISGSAFCGSDRFGFHFMFWIGFGVPGSR